MPTLAIVTNVPGDRLKASEALKELSASVAKLTGKPESVRARADVARSEEPLAGKPGAPCATPLSCSAAPRSANQATSPGRPHSGLLTPRARAQYVCVSLTQDVPLSFGGSEAPAAHATLTSIGGLGPNNASLSERISAVLQAKFGIPANRLYIDFRDVAGSNMASAARSRVLSSAYCPADAHVHRRAGTERRFETHDTR